MSDDRYGWLDEKTAELLLCGLPVDGTHLNGNGSSADRLGTALGALTTEPADALLRQASAAELPAGELPGEAAAVDAFRTAQDGVLRSRSVAAVAEPKLVGAAGVAGSGRARSGTGSGRGGFIRALPGLAGRPLRAGLAMAVAGCALGGVAVAAGAGVIPTPFSNGGGGPAKPAISVSPADTPEGAEDDEREDDQAGESEADGRKDGKHGPSHSPDDKRTGSGGPADGKSESPGGNPSPGETGKGATLPDESQKEDFIRALCKAYADGSLKDEHREKLEKAAGGAGAVQAYCAGYGYTKAPGIPGGGGEEGDGGDNGGPGGGDNGGPGGGENGGPGGGDGGDGGGGDGGGDNGGPGGGDGGDGGDSGDSAGPGGDGTDGGGTDGDSGGTGSGGSSSSAGTDGASTDTAGTGDAGGTPDSSGAESSRP